MLTICNQCKIFRKFVIDIRLGRFKHVCLVIVVEKDFSQGYFILQRSE